MPPSSPADPPRTHTLKNPMHTYHCYTNPSHPTTQLQNGALRLKSLIVKVIRITVTERRVLRHNVAKS